MHSFQTICVENGLTFDELTRVVKHLVFWGMGKVIYPICASSVYCLSKETGNILSNKGIVDQLVQKLSQLLDRGMVGDRGERATAILVEKALQMFEKPTSLLQVT